MEGVLVISGIIIFLICIFPWQAAGFFTVIGIFLYFYNENEKKKANEKAEEQRLKQEAYVKDLISRFGKNDADRILNHQIWKGMTTAMLVESKGYPGYIQEIQLKTKYKEIWSYDKIGKGKFRISVTIENSIVTGYKI
jgi:flagellar biosynthesis component FlhA